MRVDEPVDVGVIGVGSMGRHHARVYADLPSANLVGVADVDRRAARQIADEYDAVAMEVDELLTSVDAVSVAVPTSHHYELTKQCLEAEVAALVEKPIVNDLEAGRRLKAIAEATDVPVQVGHIERFNPAVKALDAVLEDRDVINVTARRLGPPPDNRIDDSAVLDLMIHDIDIVLSLFDEPPTAVKGVGVEENRHASALLEFESSAMASLTASRVTQRKVRTLEITATDCLVEVDYLDQSVEIYRNSVPEYVESGGEVRFKHESIIERPHVPNQEPLYNELKSFVDTVVSGDEPHVSIEDGLAALEVAKRIERQARANRTDIGLVVANE